MGMTIDDDYKRFCRTCGWNDSDYGCTSPSGEEIWQCPMYIHYHPAEVEKFNEEMNKREQERWND